MQRDHAVPDARVIFTEEGQPPVDSPLSLAAKDYLMRDLLGEGCLIAVADHQRAWPRVDLSIPNRPSSRWKDDRGAAIYIYKDLAGSKIEGGGVCDRLSGRNRAWAISDGAPFLRHDVREAIRVDVIHAQDTQERIGILRGHLASGQLGNRRAGLEARIEQDHRDIANGSARGPHIFDQ